MRHTNSKYRTVSLTHSQFQVVDFLARKYGISKGNLITEALRPLMRVVDDGSQVDKKDLTLAELINSFNFKAKQRRASKLIKKSDG